MEDVYQEPEAVYRAQCEAFAMGQLARLGAGSPVQGFDDLIVRMVMEEIRGRKLQRLKVRDVDANTTVRLVHVSICKQPRGNAPDQPVIQHHRTTPVSTFRTSDPPRRTRLQQSKPLILNLDASQVPIFASMQTSLQQVPGYPGRVRNGDAGWFDPAEEGATYIVSPGGGGLIINNALDAPVFHTPVVPFKCFKFRLEGSPEGLFLVCNM